MFLQTDKSNDIGENNMCSLGFHPNEQIILKKNSMQVYMSTH